MNINQIIRTLLLQCFKQYYAITTQMIRHAAHWFSLSALLLFITACGTSNTALLKHGRQPLISEEVAYQLLKSPLLGNFLCNGNIRSEISFTDLRHSNNAITFKSRIGVYKSSNQLIELDATGQFNLEIGVLLIESNTRYESWPPPNKFTLVLGRDLAGKGWEGYLEDSRFETCYRAVFTSKGGYTTNVLPVDTISPSDAFETAVNMNEVRYPWHLYVLNIAARHGDITARNYLTVFSHLINQAEQGDDVMAFDKLGDLYTYGDLFLWNFGLKSRRQYNTWFAKMYDLYSLPGYIQEKHPSNGLPKNMFFGAFWYYKAAQRGSSLAQVKLGKFYHDLKEPDDTQAAIWYKKAADQGNAEGQYRLGNLYYFGKGLKHDYKIGAQWIRKSADLGLIKGQISLATLYEFGHGVPQNFAQAALWYRKASDQGSSWAQYYLGRLYYNGKGVSQDYAMATQLYRKAADNEVYEAAGALGNMYEHGIGVKQDSRQAAYWYEQSISPAQRTKELMFNVIDSWAETERENEIRRSCKFDSLRFECM